MKMLSRTLLSGVLTLALSPAVLSAQATTISVHDATVLDIQKAFAAGTLTSEELVQIALERIGAYDQSGPKLNAILTLNESALEEARKLDQELANSGPRSPYHGIPILPKDNYDTYDLPTTGGAKALEGSIPGRDATTIARLREAGAIVIGKSNLDEFNAGSHGTSSLGGQVLNPYNLNRIPGGSSGGTGAGVAAGFAQAGLGTETGSSIRNPSSKNNLVGIASTFGLVSRHGVIPSSIALDRTGPMARNVTDAAIMLEIIAGFDPHDLVTYPAVGKVPEGGYQPFLEADALDGARIGVLRENFGKDPDDMEAVGLIEDALATMEEQGAVIIDPVLTGLDLFQALRQVRTGGGERREALEIYFAGRESPIKNVEELLEDGGILGKLVEGYERALTMPPLYKNEAYAQFMRNREAFANVIEGVMDKYDLDALVYPYQTKPAYTIAEAVVDGGHKPGASNYNVLGRGTRISTTTGFPGITVPAGFTSDGVPVGLEFLGRPWSEGPLIGLTYSYEQASKNRKLPPTTPAMPGETFELPATD